MRIQIKTAVMAAVPAILVASIPVLAQVGPADERPPFDQERHEQMIEILQEKDYDAWLEMVGERPVGDKISEEDFDAFAEAKLLFMEGDAEGARAVLEEAGLRHVGWAKRAHWIRRHPGQAMKMAGKKMRANGFHRFIDEDGDGECDWRVPTSE